MPRPKIIKRLKEKHPTLTFSQIEAVLNIFADTIIQGLINKKSIELRSFGTFFIKEIAEKKNARNPKSGELIYVPKKNKVRFRSSKKLKQLINK